MRKKMKNTKSWWKRSVRQAHAWSMSRRKAIAALAPVTGVYQEFPYGDIGKETGRLWNVYSEQWARGKMSAKEFLSTFEKEANAVLK